MRGKCEFSKRRILAHKVTHTRNRAVPGHLICMASIAFFAMGFPAAEVLLQSWGAILLIAVRTSLGCLLLVPVWFLMDGWNRIVDAHWLRGLLIGGIGFGTGTVILLVTQSMTNVVTAALVAAMMPVAAVTLEVICDRRKLTLSFVAGVMLVLIGGLIAVGESLSDSRFGIGAVMGIGATFVFAWGSRATVKDLPGMSNIGQVTLTLIGAMLFCQITLAVFLIFGWWGTQVGVLNALGLGLLTIFVLCGIVISQFLWILGVSKLGIGIASFHLNAVPFYVMLIMVAFGGSWDWDQALGATILMLGVVVAQRGNAWVEDVIPAK